MNPKLDKYEREIEANISKFTPASNDKKALVESVIDKANEKKSISLRLKSNDLEQLKRRAEIEGLPYEVVGKTRRCENVESAFGRNGYIRSATMTAEARKEAEEKEREEGEKGRRRRGGDGR